MFVFVRQMQEFNWTPYWREHPKDIAELIERAHAYQYGANTTFWEDNLEDGSGKEEFIAIWIGMRFPAHAPPLKLAAQEAEKLPLQLLQPHSEAYGKIVSLAGHLQRRVGDADIALPQVAIGKVLGIAQRTASMYLQLAERECFLRKTARHNHAQKKAALYRFDLGRFDWKNGKERK